MCAGLPSGPAELVQARVVDPEMVRDLVDHRDPDLSHDVGFGARPGDVERVQQIGLSAYIDQQLRPSARTTDER